MFFTGTLVGFELAEFTDLVSMLIGMMLTLTEAKIAIFHVVVDLLRHNNAILNLSVRDLDDIIGALQFTDIDADLHFLGTHESWLWHRVVSDIVLFVIVITIFIIEVLIVILIINILIKVFVIVLISVLIELEAIFLVVILSRSSDIGRGI